MPQSRKSPDFSLDSELLEKVDIRSIIHPLWLNKWLIVSITAICLLLGIFFSYLKVPLYSSNVLLQVNDKGNNLFSSEKEMGSLFSAKANSVSETQSVLMRSRYILAPVIDRLQLDISVTPARFPVLGEWYARRHSGAYNRPWWGSSQYAWGSEKLKVSRFSVPQPFENKRLTLIVNDQNQYELYDDQQAILLKGVVGKLQQVDVPGKGRFTLKIDEIDAGKNTHFYLKKLSTQKMADELASRLNIADLSQEMDVRSQTGVLKISMIGTSPQQLISILNTLAEVAVAKNAEKKAEEATQALAFIKQKLPQVKNALYDAETALNTYLAKEHMLSLSTESKLLLSELGDTYKQLSSLKSRKQSALKRYTIHHPFIITLTEKENVAQAELKTLKKEVSELPTRDQIAVNLTRDVRVKNQLYMTMLNKAQSLEMARGGMISDVSILSSAIYPDKPLPGGMLKISFFSLLAGLLLGFAVVYLQVIWNRKFSDPSLIESKFGLINMAIVPFSEKQMHLLTTRHQSPASVPLLASKDPKDLSIEALRSFRTSSQFAMLDARNNIISILGIAPGVGKSFVSANIAYLHADTGKKVLLIDGDIRRGHLRDYFNSDTTIGLSEVICGIEAIENAIIHTPIQNLDFLATGLYPPNPSEILMSQQFKKLLEFVSSQYDLVIIDTAPILAVTDAAIIAQLTGANFLVLASNMHETKEIDFALKQFKQNGVMINGVVFNFSKEEKGIYRQAQAFNYQYDYSG